ncbi:methyltransferase domain-containing protein [Nanoarchaeota archaeon]
MIIDLGHSKVIKEYFSEFDMAQQIIDRLEPQEMPPIEFGCPNDEKFHRTQSTEDSDFDERRKWRKDQLIKLTNFLWEYYNLPRENITEYGAGSTGYYWANLRPKGIEDWLQVDINPLANKENGRRNPGAKIIEGSCYDIPSRGCHLITGLALLDTVSDIPLAVDQIAEALAEGGYLFHILDNYPGHRGVKEYLIASRGSIPEEGFRAKFRGNIFAQPTILGFVIDQKRETLINLFRDAMGDAIKKQPSLDLIANDYFTYSEPIDRPEHQALFMGLRYENPAEKGVKTTTALITLAQKKEVY